MKPRKHVLMLIAVVVAAVAMAGCAGENEDFETKVSELAETKSRLEQANVKIAQLQTSLDEARAQTTVVVTEEPVAESETAMEDEGTQEESATAEQDAADLQAKVASLTQENNRLQGLLDQMKAKMAQLKEKLSAPVEAPVKAPVRDMPTELPKKY
jgi:outer membrane murein-binding lipoprotein Lpp